MVEQDVSADAVPAMDFNIDGILKKMLKLFNNPSAPVCKNLSIDLIYIQLISCKIRIGILFMSRMVSVSFCVNIY